VERQVTELNPTAAALLGFLAGGELSGYELAKAAGELIGDFWHVTRSQVYRELAALSDRGLIIPAGTGPRARQPYQITEAGREAFAGWVAQQPQLEQIRYPLLLTMAFGSWLGPERLLQFAEAHRSAHEERLARYRSLQADPGLDNYQQATVAFGVRYEEAVLAWMSDLPGILAGHARGASG
jgi:DNA-binding PadR family transcriptional regulator